MKRLLACAAIATCAANAEAQPGRDPRTGPLTPSVKIEGAQLGSLTNAKFSAQASQSASGSARQKAPTSIALTLTLAKGPDKTMETWFGGDQAPRNVEIAFLDRTGKVSLTYEVQNCTPTGVEWSASSTGQETPADVWTLSCTSFRRS